MNAPMLLASIGGLPMALTLTLGLLLWFRILCREEVFARLTGWTFTLSALGALALIPSLARSEEPVVWLRIGTWFGVADYHFDWVLVADRLSTPFAIFTAALVGLVGAFSRRYLHREPGFFRFYFLLSAFGAGVQLVVLAGSLDLVFVGWEVVGLTSALLIAYFHERRNPVEHALRAFITYRFCDVGLLTAAVWMHHTMGTASVSPTSGGEWFGFSAPTLAADATVIGLLLLWAAMGKSAQVPLGGWLPRAMEGPTPSSAIFYGALSIHLGPYLLLRAAPVVATSPVATWAIIVVGLATAAHGTFVGRVQSDIKSALSYASMTQVGLIFVEIGLGLSSLALVHIIGHACLRSLQILRSPSLLHDHHHLEQAMGQILPRTGGHFERLVPRVLQPWLYRHALERGYFDALLQDWVIGGPVRILRKIDAADERWTRWLAGSAESTTLETGSRPPKAVGS